MTESAPGIAFQLLDGSQAAGHEPELLELRTEVRSEAPVLPDDEAEGLRPRLKVQFRQPGFALAEARHGGYLVGYAAGWPLRPSSAWWRNLTTALPAEVTTEHPGRTFALADLLVRASWRRQGIGADLHRLILAGRPEERATITVRPAATAAQRAFRSWGWDKVARTRGPGPGAPACDVLLLTRLAGRP
jgi:ribosomal protein S18 acetylase RimI-like enzyme